MQQNPVMLNFFMYFQGFPEIVWQTETYPKMVKNSAFAGRSSTIKAVWSKYRSYMFSIDFSKYKKEVWVFRAVYSKCGSMFPKKLARRDAV